MEGLLEVGQIVNSYGIRGFLKVVPWVDKKEQFESFKTLYIQSQNTTQTIEIQEVKYSKDLVLLKVVGIETVEDALKLKNEILLAKREDIALEEGAHFIVDLIGLDVVTEEGESLGTLTDVLQPGANDVYVVKKEDKEILLPAIPDVVKNIDIKAGKITVHLLNGLV